MLANVWHDAGNLTRSLVNPCTFIAASRGDDGTRVSDKDHISGTSIACASNESNFGTSVIVGRVVRWALRRVDNGCLNSSQGNSCDRFASAKQSFTGNSHTCAPHTFRRANTVDNATAQVLPFATTDPCTGRSRDKDVASRSLDIINNNLDSVIRRTDNLRDAAPGKSDRDDTAGSGKHSGTADGDRGACLTSSRAGRVDRSGGNVFPPVLERSLGTSVEIEHHVTLHSFRACSCNNLHKDVRLAVQALNFYTSQEDSVHG